MPVIAVITGFIVLTIHYFTNIPQPSYILPIIGGLLILGGLIAMIGGKVRMHAMHIAAMMGLAALADGLYLMTATDTNKSISALLTILAAFFLILCIKSFIDARRNRPETP